MIVKSQTLIIAMTFFMSLVFPAQAQFGVEVTQRRINRLAAALAQTRYTLVEETKLRREGETLSSYFARLTQRQPQETEAQRQTRLKRYLAALDEAAEATVSIRILPKLTAPRKPNWLLWQQAVRSAKAMPERAQRARLAWMKTQGQTVAAPVTLESLPKALENGLRTAQTLFDLLRDATP